MGDPKKHRSKYSGPSHPWQKERITEEIVLVKEYGLKNKKEIWRHVSALRNYAKRAKQLIAATGSQSDRERQELLQKMRSIGLLDEQGSIEAILTLQIKNILDRRLQSVVFRKKLSRSMHQARQFISHGHIIVGDRKITSPGHIVTTIKENQIKFIENSSLADISHPEREEVKEKK